MCAGNGARWTRAAAAREAMSRAACCNLIRTKIAERFGVVGGEPERLSVSLDGAVRLAEGLVGAVQSGVVFGIARHDCQRLADQRRCPPCLSLLKRHHTEEMKRFVPARVFGQCRFIPGGGPLEFASPMLLDRRAQIDRHRVGGPIGGSEHDSIGSLRKRYRLLRVRTISIMITARESSAWVGWECRAWRVHLRRPVRLALWVWPRPEVH